LRKHCPRTSTKKMKWRCWVVFSSVQLSKNKPNIYQKYIQIYSNISKIYQDIPRYTKYQAAAGPPRSWIHLNIFGYIFGMFLVYFGYIFGQCRLQLKRGLFWYWHHPKMNEMVSDRSSRAENLTDRRKISMRVFFYSKNVEKLSYGRKQLKNVVFRWNKYLRSYTGLTKFGKKQKTYNPIKFINLIIYN
jgi:hypothetical protein